MTYRGIICIIHHPMMQLRSHLPTLLQLSLQLIKKIIQSFPEGLTLPPFMPPLPLRLNQRSPSNIVATACANENEVSALPFDREGRSAGPEGEIENREADGFGAALGVLVVLFLRLV